MIEFLIRFPIIYLPILAMLIMPSVFRKFKNILNLKQYVVLLFSILAIENMLDYVFTMKGINAGRIAEANTIADVLIKNGSLGQFKGIASLIYCNSNNTNH